MMIVFRRLLCAILIFSLLGCGWKVTPPPGYDSNKRENRIADQVFLKVNDSGVFWGGGKLGETVRDTLVENGSFKEVYFPVEPRNPPPLRLMIDAKGNVDEEKGLGTLKAIFIGALFFLPVGIVRFNKDFNLEADVSLYKQNKELHTFKIKSSTEISHTMFSQATQYEPEARRIAFKDLGNKIAAELGKVPLGGD
jgi:hypothetical protein